MGCLKGKDKCKKSKATHRCDKCGARSDSSKGLCKPKKINTEKDADDGKEKQDKDKKKKKSKKDRE